MKLISPSTITPENIHELNTQYTGKNYIKIVKFIIQLEYPKYYKYYSEDSNTFLFWLKTLSKKDLIKLYILYND